MAIGTLSAIPFGLGAAEGTIAAIGVSTGLTTATTLVVALGMRLALTLPLALAGAGSYILLSRRLGREFEGLQEVAMAGLETT